MRPEILVPDKPANIWWINRTVSDQAPAKFYIVIANDSQARRCLLEQGDYRILTEGPPRRVGVTWRGHY